MKRVLAIADLHCGHKGALVPPGHQRTQQQKRFWRWWLERCRQVRPVDYLIVNGDAIDGPGHKSGGTELITTDREKQVYMAALCLLPLEARKTIVTAGTPYHVGNNEDWEKILAASIGGSFHGNYKGSIEGVSFDVKHHVDPSSVPHGPATPLLKQQLWELVAGECPGVIVRSHTHRYLAIENSNGRCYITPGMQLWSKYGERKVIGRTDVGFLLFGIDKGKIEHKVFLYEAAKK